MNKSKLTRVICLLLALVTLASSSVIAVSAKTLVGDNITTKSISKYASKLVTGDYQTYMEQFDEVAKLSANTTFDLTDNWVYVSDDETFTITMTNGVWQMTAGTTTYDSVAQALAATDAKGNPKYVQDDLCYVTTYDGVKALYTPSTGSVSWNLNLTVTGLNTAFLCSIGLNYYPVIAKPASIEREFYINGEAPFSEARSLTLSKVWTSVQQDETALEGVYEFTKKQIKKGEEEAIKTELEEAGLTVRFSADRKSLVITQPLVMTEKIANAIDKYELRFFTLDKNDNEIRANQIQTPVWTKYYFRDGQGYNFASGAYTSDFFGFVLTPDEFGKVTFKLEGVNEPVALSTVELLPYQNNISYADYVAGVIAEVGDKKGTDTIKIEAEYTTSSSTNVVYPVEDRTNAYTSPADTSRTLLNTIGTEKWETSGQWIEYQFTVDNSGFYNIYTRFRQSYLDGMYVNRALTLYTNEATKAAYVTKYGHAAGYYDGAPFAEASQLRYNYDNNWQVTSLTSSVIKNVASVDDNGKTVTTQTAVDNSDMQVYFEKGVVYTLRLEVTLGSMSDLIAQIQEVLTKLNEDYLTILKLTGTSPDDYRDYSFSRLLPDTLIDMIKQANNLDSISTFLKDSAGVASTYTGVCDKLSNLLRKMALDEDEIAKNLDNLKTYVGSLGTFLTDAKTQPLQIDYISIQPVEAKAPKAMPNFFVSMWHEIKSFFQSFFRDYNSMGAMDTEEINTTISVWLPYGRDQATVIRNLSTNDFTQETGVAVDLKLITVGTLLPSILAGMGPDVYLGLAQANVINYAIRGALEDVSDMDGFNEALVNFNDAAITVLQIADEDGDLHTYGLPENQEFPMMFVRLDVLNDVGIEIPKTWEDVYVAQSKLQANNMQIGMIQSYKTFLYQLGGDLWADKGMRINLDSVVGLEAFNTMCDMYTQYSFPYSYDAANRFRTGEMPIIIAQYITLYNKLKVFATEIEGSWTFVPVPGYEYLDEDGNTIIKNYSISTSTSVSIISGIEDSAEKAASWEYVKWYTGADAQSEYANEMVAILGDSAKHSTANREALKSMPWTAEEYLEVSKQFENLASVANYPGYYYIDRYTEFAFLAALNNGANATTEILSYINTINNEITRKRQEFKLETLEIGQTLAQKRIDQAKSGMKQLESRLGNDATYDNALLLAKYGIANNDIDSLKNASVAFMNVLKGKWTADGSQTKEITKVSGKTEVVPTYYVNVGKQTAETKNGGYKIASLDDMTLVYFIATCLNDAACALETY